MPGFNIIFIISILVFVAIFVFAVLLIFSPKVRGKMMSRQIKSLKYMTDYSKEDLESAMTNLGNVSINTKSNIQQ